MSVPSNTSKDERVLRLPEVARLTGLSKSGVYQAIQDNNFPKQIKLGKRASGFLLSEVHAWIIGRAEAREVNNA